MILESEMKNKHVGSDFNEFLKNEDIFKETHNVAIKKAIVYQLEQEMKAQKITKTKMAQMMNASLAVVSRLLDPNNDSLTLSTLISAANALGKRVHISIL